VALDANKLKRYLTELPEPEANPVLIIISGLPGAGKSYFSRQLAAKLPSVVLESDFLRKKLFPTPIYSNTENQYLFSACHYLIEELLASGRTVIFDATNLVEHNREMLYRIAERAKAKIIIVQVKAPANVLHQRLSDRRHFSNPEEYSDADWQTYEMMKKQAQRIRRNYYSVDTSKDIGPVLAKILREANR